MKHELGLPFSPRNLPIKFGTNPSTFLVIVVKDRQTDTQTHKPTPVKTHSLAFAGIIIVTNTSNHIVSLIYSFIIFILQLGLNLVVLKEDNE